MNKKKLIFHKKCELVDINNETLYSTDLGIKDDDNRLDFYLDLTINTNYKKSDNMYSDVQSVEQDFIDNVFNTIIWHSFLTRNIYNHIAHSVKNVYMSSLKKKIPIEVFINFKIRENVYIFQINPELFKEFINKLHKIGSTNETITIKFESI